MYTFKSIKHNIFTNLIRKVALNHKDDKRFLIPDSIETLAWGHKDIIRFLNKHDRQDKRLDGLVALLREMCKMSRPKKCKKRLTFE